MKLDINNYIKFWAKKVDSWLDQNVISNSQYIDGLVDAMRYSLFAGGKRLRPALIYSSFGIFDGYFDKVTPFAAAVEMLHTYSLIHDDLPAMDDDDLRRGKPTNHVVYGEGVAILAGDALLTKAFEVMTSSSLNPDVEPAMMLEAANKLAIATGEKGMVGGQYADLKAEGGFFDEGTVSFIHLNKTAALISYCCELGAILGYASDGERKDMSQFGKKIGLAFQIIDDILDLTCTTEELGKNAKSDLKKEKATYPAIFGIEKSRKIADDLIFSAFGILDKYGEAAVPLRELASFVVERKN
ncbi:MULTISPECIES: polyprenyl synthetase family protein [Calditerrivibrio]|uniref:polyprenyl synthetase family protein n=1 Tax=Calditerrivibrio TaxID=545865 RepID=UPI003C71BB68